LNTKHQQPCCDIILFRTACLLIVISIVFSYSLSIYTVEYYDFSRLHFFIRQLAFGILSILLMWYMSKIDPEKYFDKIGSFIFFSSFIVIVVMPFLPNALVQETMGAKRWIRIFGFSIAPVEFFKIGFAYFLSRSFNKNLLTKDKHMRFKDELKLYTPYGLLFLLLVPIIALAQKDFGQLVVLVVLTFVMLMFANRSYRIFVILGLLGIVALVSLVLIAPYRLNRIYSWWSMVQDNVLSVLPQFLSTALRIESYPEPYQVGHSLNAIYNGGFFGQGLGNGLLKMGYLSEVHTDFVLAGITEEVGWIGLFVIVTIIIFLIQRILRVSRLTNKPAHHLFALGIALLLSTPLLINFGGITGSIPIKGIAVPFLSYGGSSMFALALGVGMVLSISRENNKISKQKEDI